LAFHPHPQVIPQVFNPGGFGPPRSLTSASACPWVDHSDSGLEHATMFARLGLAFATAPSHDLTLPRTTNSPAHSSKGTPSPRPGCPGTRLRQLVGSRFQVLFHSPPGVLFTFPSRYWFTIGRQGVLSLRGWAPQIHTGFHVPRITREHRSEAGRFSPTGLLPSAAVFSMNLRLTAGFVTP
jgi:hypothetical protein